MMTRKDKSAFNSIRKGLTQALDHARGEGNGATVHEVRVPAPDVAAIRAKTGLSQSAFAKSIGVALGTLQGWEQGRRRPDGPARVLLALIDRRPGIVQDELAA
jgi:putative transcriptional regulator